MNEALIPYLEDSRRIPRKNSEEYIFLKERITLDIERLKIVSVLMDYAIASVDTLRTPHAEAMDMVKGA